MPMVLSPVTLPLGGRHRARPPATPARQRGASLQTAHSMPLPGQQGRESPFL
jgi:hypothetical protein